MATILTRIPLFMPHRGAPVQHHVGLDGREALTPGVRALVVLQGGLAWGLLADHPRQGDVAVTNGAGEYAQVAANHAGCPIQGVLWFSLDTECRYDRLHIAPSGAVRYEAVHAPGWPTSSYQAMRSFLRSQGFDLDGSPMAAALAWACGAV